MGLASFNRMRRMRAGRTVDVKTDTPAAGMNIRETIVERLKEKHIPHSMADAKAAAQEAKRGLRRGRGKADGEPRVQTDRLHAEPGMGPVGDILNIRETLTDEVKREAKADASVVVAEGRIVGRAEDPERVSQFSAEHYAPPTSVSPGTDGVVPKDTETKPPPTAADPDAWPAESTRSPNALGARDEEGERKDGERRRRTAENETAKIADEKRREAEEAETRREELSASTANQAERGDLPGKEEAERRAADRAKRDRALRREAKEEARHEVESRGSAEGAERGTAEEKPPARSRSRGSGSRARGAKRKKG